MDEALFFGHERNWAHRKMLENQYWQAIEKFRRHCDFKLLMGKALKMRIASPQPRSSQERGQVRKMIANLKS